MAIQWTKHPILKLPDAEQVRAMGVESAFALWKRRESLIAAEKADPFNYGFDHHNSGGHFQHWKEMDTLLDDPEITTIYLFGGNRCIEGDTPIYNPLTGKSVPVSRIAGQHVVLAWNGLGLVPALAGQPFVKGCDRFLEVRLSDGSSFEATAEHRVLSSFGEYVPLSQLRRGSQLFLPSTSGALSPSKFAQGALNCPEILPGFQADYFPCCRQCGGQLHLGTEHAQAAFPLLTDALRSSYLGGSSRKHSVLLLDCVEQLQGGRGNILRCSHCGFESAPLSNWGDLARSGVPFFDTESRAFYKAYKSVLELFGDRQSFEACELSLLGLSPQRSTAEPVQLDNQCSLPSKVTIHQEVIEIKEKGVGPVWDFRVPFYDNYWACGAVHHNSGKTEYMAKRLMQKMASIPNYAAWVGGLSGESSIQVQQAAIHKYIPKEWARQRRGVRQVNNIAFTPKNGFSNSSFIGPNGSSCRFKNYTQDVKTLEGSNLDLFWADELVPFTWVQTMKYRLIGRRGKMVISFTPIEGYTPTVKDAMAGHVVTKWLPCDKSVMPSGRMPFVGRTRTGDAIIWFFSEHNPYIPWDHFKKTALNGKTTTEKEIRAYGYVKNPIIGKFPRFSDVHIVKRDQIPKQGTNYMCVDPTGGDRNWFMVWVRVDDMGRVFAYREWPNLARYGEWAVPSSKADGSPGSAQKADCGRNLTQYRTLIRDLEKGEREPLVRYIDPRAGRAPILSASQGNYSLVDHLSKDEMATDGTLKEAGMVFTPAAQTEIDEGVQAVNNLLSYNMDEPVSGVNEPKLYISEDCGNLIYALREWTNEDKDKGACKDPVDALRYLISMDPIHVSPGQSFDQGGGYY